MRRAIAIDFDGCICQSKYPEIGEPNWHVIEEAKKEQAAGAGLILWTCRAGKELDAAIAACKEWGLNFDAVNQSLPEWIEAWGSDSRKVGADESTTWEKRLSRWRRKIKRWLALSAGRSLRRLKMRSRTMASFDSTKESSATEERTLW